MKVNKVFGSKKYLYNFVNLINIKKSKTNGTN
jgi:hypothetical protein